jgi:hypothetical protein
MSTPFRCYLLTVGLLVSLPRGLTLHAAQSASETLCVVTFNLRFASDSKPNSWPERRPALRACVEEMAPDVMGTQEGLYPFF